jgi:Sap, sulfolipid-1-addressing protein
MNLEALVLGVFSGLRPGTSLAAVLALLEAPKPQRHLLFFTAAGLASSWAIGLVVVGVFHGANVAVGGSTFTAVLDVALGAAALGFAVGLQQGWVQSTGPQLQPTRSRRLRRPR